MAETAPRQLTLTELVVQSLRNLSEARLELGARLNVFTGNNGQGKTSLLEAIYLLATSRSFRTARVSELVQHGAALGSVRGVFVEHWPGGPVRRDQSVGLQGSKRTIRLDGQDPPSLAHYATRSPVVVFDPRQLALSTGPASERRLLLDRIALFLDPAAAMHRSRYLRALKERQRLLAQRVLPSRADAAGSSSELDAYESLLAEHGAELTRARREATRLLTESVAPAFRGIAEPGLELAVSYAPGGSEDREHARRELFAARGRDARQKQASFGPQRDDVALSLGGHAARVVASQGQHRAITLALKVAEMACIARAREVLPLLLLDDVSSELDAERTSALLALLAGTESQILLTTTRPEVLATARATAGERRDFTVRAGRIELAPRTG